LGLAFDALNNRLFVSDYHNSRVMVFSTASIVNGMNASSVLGQSNFTTKVAAATQSGLSNPSELALDSVNKLLYVSDYTNNRVMVFSTASVSNGESASFELGQPGGSTAFTSNGAAATQAGLNGPQGMALDSADNLLYVADYGNNRVMAFSTATPANGKNASYELGQPAGANAFSTSGHATAPSGLYAPLGLSFDASNYRLFVGDSRNDRVLVFNVALSTLANGENASIVLGQSSLTTRSAATTQSGLYQPRNLFYDPSSGRLYVADSTNDRVMIFNASTGN
jgi:DNA-binding beta-propeller fold protein YncE